MARIMIWFCFLLVVVVEGRFLTHHQIKLREDPEVDDGTESAGIATGDNTTTDAQEEDLISDSTSGNAEEEVSIDPTNPDNEDVTSYDENMDTSSSIHAEPAGENPGDFEGSDLIHDGPDDPEEKKEDDSFLPDWVEDIFEEEENDEEIYQNEESLEEQFPCPHHGPDDYMLLQNKRTNKIISAKSHRKRIVLKNKKTGEDVGTLDLEIDVDVDMEEFDATSYCGAEEYVLWENGSEPACKLRLGEGAPCLAFSHVEMNVCHEGFVCGSICPAENQYSYVCMREEDAMCLPPQRVECEHVNPANSTFSMAMDFGYLPAGSEDEEEVYERKTSHSLQDLSDMLDEHCHSSPYAMEISECLRMGCCPAEMMDDALHAVATAQWHRTVEKIVENCGSEDCGPGLLKELKSRDFEDEGVEEMHGELDGEFGNGPHKEDEPGGEEEDEQDVSKEDKKANKAEKNADKEAKKATGEVEKEAKTAEKTAKKNENEAKKAEKEAEKDAKKQAKMEKKQAMQDKMKAEKEAKTAKAEAEAASDAVNDVQATLGGDSAGSETEEERGAEKPPESVKMSKDQQIAADQANYT